MRRVIRRCNMEYEIEQINGDNWRPGMPKAGFLVRYGINEFGWMYCQTFATLEEAEAFAEAIK